MPQHRLATGTVTASWEPYSLGRDRRTIYRVRDLGAGQSLVLRSGEQFRDHDGPSHRVK